MFIRKSEARAQTKVSAVFLHFFLLFSISSLGQFAGPVGSANTTAIYKDSSVFQGWAASCVVNRGYQDISDPGLGFASAGSDSAVVGKAGENGVLSLGDGGSAVVTFYAPLYNGPGFDFAVFENGFSDQFLELAFVEVSSNGVDFVRFPAISNTPFDAQVGAFDLDGDASLINNLAGKYRAFYGTPFDLEELKDHPLLDVNSVTHVKIIDVVGSVLHQYASFDINGHPINDPWPTPFETSGFDLDAVGAIHIQNASVTHLKTEDVNLFPNPFHSNFQLNITSHTCKSISITDLQGRVMQQIKPAGQWLHVDTEHWSTGVYIMKIEWNDATVSTRKIIRN